MRILIVDDSKAMRMIIRRTLRQAGYGGCEIVEACDAGEALDSIKKGGVDFVLTDWNMPGKSGLELIKDVQQMDRPVKIGMITSQGAPEMKAEASDAGAAFVLTKPFTADSLRNRLEAVLA